MNTWSVDRPNKTDTWCVDGPLKWTGRCPRNSQSPRNSQGPRNSQFLRNSQCPRNSQFLRNSQCPTNSQCHRRDDAHPHLKYITPILHQWSQGMFRLTSKQHMQAKTDSTFQQPRPMWSYPPAGAHRHPRMGWGWGDFHRKTTCAMRLGFFEVPQSVLSGV